MGHDKKYKYRLNSIVNGLKRETGREIDTYYRDFNQMQWELNQRKKGRYIFSMGLGDHYRWIAIEDRDALSRYLDKVQKDCKDEPESFKYEQRNILSSYSKNFSPEEKALLSDGLSIEEKTR